MTRVRGSPAGQVTHLLISGTGGLPRRRRAAHVAGLSALVGANLAAGSGFHRAFEPAALAGTLTLAVAVPGAMAAVLHHPYRRHRPIGRPGSDRVGSTFFPRAPAVVFGVYALLWAVVAIIAAAVLGTGGPGLVGGAELAARGLVNDWAWLLDTTLPAPAEPVLLAVPFTLVWVAMATGVELALTTRAPFLPALPALLVFALSVLFTVPGPGSNVPTASVFAALVAVFIALRRISRRRPLHRATDSAGSLARTTPGAAAPPGQGRPPTILPRPGPRARMIMIAVGALALGPIVVTALPVLGDATPFDLRQHRPVTVALPAGISPLDRVSDWLTHPDDILFSVETSNPTRMRLAVLDSFNGERWTTTARFTRAGLGVPAATSCRGDLRGTQPPHVVERSRQKITIKGLAGDFLPAADRPWRLRGDGLLVDVETGVLASPSPVRRGFDYTVESVVSAEPTAETRVGLRPSDGDAVTPAPQPWIPPAIRGLAERATRPGTPPYQQASDLAFYLNSREFVNDPVSPPGHSPQRLDRFLTRWRRGTTEQFATAFALAARSLGLPTRIVVGFAAGTRDPAAPSSEVPHYDVRGRDARVWAEICFEGVGWLPFDPTPRHVGEHVPQDDTVTVDRPLVSDPAPAVAPSVPPPNPAESPGTGAGRKALPGIGLLDPPDTQRPGPRHVIPLLVLLTGGLALGLLYLSVVAAVPAARRRRSRRAPSPDERVIGAWYDMLLSFALSGLSPQTSLTAGEIVDAGSTMAGAGSRQPTRILADLADRVLYAPTQVSAEDANAAWAAADDLRGWLWRSRNWRQRCRAVVSPRRLRGPAWVVGRPTPRRRYP